MGEMADYYMDVALEQDFKAHAEAEERHRIAKEILESYKMGIAEWETKNDGFISVVDMKDEHVKNCLNFLLKGKKTNGNEITESWIKIFKAECKKRKIKYIL